jgi:sugar lactone lactonase YvrE
MQIKSGLIVLPLSLLILGALVRQAGSVDKIYWADMGTAKIQRADLDGTNVEDLVSSGLSSPAGIALDASAGKMYWTDAVTDKIQRANLDGSGVEDLVSSGLEMAYGIALDVPAGKMYWTDWGLGTIRRADLDGSDTEVLITGLQTLDGITVDVSAGKMYWASVMAGKIQRADLDGSDVEDLIYSAGTTPAMVALDLSGGKMYWTDYMGGKIRRADLDGSDVEDLITSGLVYPAGITLDVSAGKMYWTNQGTAKIQRADLDGSNVVDLVTGLGNPAGTVLYSGPTLVTLTSFTALIQLQGVLVSWETSAELDCAGFHVWRSGCSGTGANDYVRITETLVPARGSPSQGAAYAFSDNEAPDPCPGLCYKLQDFDSAGNSVFYGPVEAVAAGPEPQTWSVPLAGVLVREPGTSWVSGTFGALFLILLPAGSILLLKRRKNPDRQ